MRRPLHGDAVDPLARFAMTVDHGNDYNRFLVDAIYQ